VYKFPPYPSELEHLRSRTYEGEIIEERLSLVMQMLKAKIDVVCVNRKTVECFLFRFDKARPMHVYVPTSSGYSASLMKSARLSSWFSSSEDLKNFRFFAVPSVIVPAAMSKEKQVDPWGQSWRADDLDALASVFLNCPGLCLTGTYGDPFDSYHPFYSAAFDDDMTLKTDHEYAECDYTKGRVKEFEDLCGKVSLNERLHTHEDPNDALHDYIMETVRKLRDLRIKLQDNLLLWYQAPDDFLEKLLEPHYTWRCTSNVDDPMFRQRVCTSPIKLDDMSEKV